MLWLCLQGPPVARQLLHIVVYGVDQLPRRLAGLGVEDQVSAQLVQLLEVGGDGLGAPFLTALAFPLRMERFAAARFSALVIPQQKLFHARGANYQSFGGGNGVEPPAVAGVEKSVVLRGSRFTRAGCCRAIGLWSSTMAH
jgi:hypothetical protein